MKYNETRKNNQFAFNHNQDNLAVKLHWKQHFCSFHFVICMYTSLSLLIPFCYFYVDFFVTASSLVGTSPDYETVSLFSIISRHACSNISLEITFLLISFYLYIDLFVIASSLIGASPNYA